MRKLRINSPGAHVSQSLNIPVQWSTVDDEIAVHQNQIYAAVSLYSRSIYLAGLTALLREMGQVSRTSRSHLLV